MGVSCCHSAASGMASAPYASVMESWAKKAGWETLLNRAGTTFKKLPDKDKDGITEAKAIKLMLAQPSMIKRPVLELARGKLLVGFKPEAYEEAFSQN